MSVMQLKKNKMKHLYLGIQDDKYNFFVELIKNLNFVKIEYDEMPVAKSKKEIIIANIKKGFADKKAIDKGELKTFPIENLFDE
ncbi:MAG: hypothetical protein FWF51_05865 [Chitinivibrionia bacterium]|nr:hypothetical protein [Chitinivibrionia bacterium]